MPGLPAGPAAPPLTAQAARESGGSEEGVCRAGDPCAAPCVYGEKPARKGMKGGNLACMQVEERTDTIREEIDLKGES